VNMCPSLVEIRSVTSKIRHRKKEKTTTVKYKPFGVQANNKSIYRWRLMANTCIRYSATTLTNVISLCHFYHVAYCVPIPNAYACTLPCTSIWQMPNMV